MFKMLFCALGLHPSYRCVIDPDQPRMFCPNCESWVRLKGKAADAWAEHRFNEAMRKTGRPLPSRTLGW